MKPNLTLATMNTQNIGRQKVTHCQFIKNCIKSRLVFFIRLKHQSSTIVSAVCINYSVFDLLCDVINNAWSTN